MLPGIPSGVPSFGFPLGVKALIGINVLMYGLEFLWPNLARNYSLAPALISANFSEYCVSVFLASFLHMPMSSHTGLMGVMHLVMNMATLFAIGSELEEKMGTTAFFTMSLVFSVSVGLLSTPLAFFLEGFAGDALNYTHVRWLGYSGILFAYFMVYLKVTPDEVVVLCGRPMFKWVIPFANLILLTIVIHTSFIAHLSGIIIGCVYISGFPGCFDMRHRLLQVLESFGFMNEITGRDDFYALSHIPVINEWDNPCSNMPTSLDSVPLGESVIPKGSFQQSEPPMHDSIP